MNYIMRNSLDTLKNGLIKRSDEIGTLNNDTYFALWTFTILVKERVPCLYIGRLRSAPPVKMIQFAGDYGFSQLFAVHLVSMKLHCLALRKNLARIL